MPDSVDKFKKLLTEVCMKSSVKAIAVNCLVPSAKVEAWLKGKDLPQRSVLPVLNRVLQYMQRYHEQSTETEKAQSCNKGVA
jgi:hypothetical protein